MSSPSRMVSSTVPASLGPVVIGILLAFQRRLSSVLPINSEYSLEGLRLKLKFQYFGHPMLRTDSLEKTLMPGKINDRRRRGQQKMRWFDGITD